MTEPNLSVRISYSIGEAARILGVRYTLIWHEIQRGVLRTARVGTRHLIPRDEFERYCHARRLPPPPDPDTLPVGKAARDRAGRAA